MLRTQFLRFLKDVRPPLIVETDSCLQLSKHVCSKEKNFVYSPLSMYLALSLLTSGSNGGTFKQLSSFLKSDNLDHLNSVGSKLIDLVSRTGINGGGERKQLGPKLSFISGVWVENSWTLKPHFKGIANSFYRAQVEAVDFKTKANEVKEKVNKWVEKETNGLIKDLLPHGSINHETRVVLANALYFKGEWNQVFDPAMTETSEFHLLNGVGSVQVPFMTSREEQFVSYFNGFKVLQLPYKQAINDPCERHFSMYIVLPDQRDGLWDLIQKVGSDSSFLDCHLPRKRVEMGQFRIPKFKVLADFEASDALKELGIVLPFDGTEADFSEMADQLDGGKKRFCVSSVIHKCYVEVDEIGSEAAAATAIIMGRSSCLQSPKTPKDFVADHPFMFFIRENLSGVVLFMGHVLNPLLKTE